MEDKLRPTYVVRTSLTRQRILISSKSAYLFCECDGRFRKPQILASVQGHKNAPLVLKVVLYITGAVANDK